MSKSQKTSKASEEKKKTAAKAAPAKTKAKPAAKTKAPAAPKPAAKPAKPAAKKPAPAKTVKKAAPAKAAKKDTAVAKAEKPAKKSATQAKAKSSTARVEKLSKTAPAAAKKPMKEPASTAKIPAFSNSGLGVKVSNKKPGLSIAPGVMILGKTVASKTEAPEKVIERKLSKKELADIKTILLDKRERLLAGMRRELAVQRERSESKAADEVDKATDAYDEDLSFEIAAANDQELGEIQVALEKIDKGTYGECEICGCTISPSRLKILPFATTCVSCRNQDEMARRRDDGNLLFNMMSGEDADGESGDL